MSLNIIATGKGLPGRLLTSLEIDEQLHLKAGRTEKLSGLSQRYFLAEGETADRMQLQAIQAALSAAQLSANDIDCVINASATHRQALPFNAAHSVRLLNPGRPIAAFDVNMTCLSALRGMDLANLLLSQYRTILMISCDVASVGLDWQDFHSSTIFGDGAAAVIFQTAGNGIGGVLASHFELYPEGYEYCTIPAGGYQNHPAHSSHYVQQAYFHMNGKKLYKLVADIMPQFLDRTLAKGCLKMNDINWIVPHQASRGALDHLISKLQLSRQKIVDIFGTHGNQVATSIPTALHHLLTEYPVQSGDKVLLCGTSAGVGLGALVWQKP